MDRVPQGLKENIYGTLRQLEEGQKFKMPFCRPLFKVNKGLYELRYSYKAGEYRVFYYIRIAGAIYVIHAMKKKSRKIDLKTMNLLRSRIRSLS